MLNKTIVKIIFQNKYKIENISIYFTPLFFDLIISNHKKLSYKKIVLFISFILSIYFSKLVKNISECNNILIISFT